MPTGSTMNAPRQAGAGLVEVAIALLLLSIGALGLANMQIGAKRLGFEALQRTEAAALAGDLFERMRANRQGLQRYRSAGIGEGSGRQLAVPGRNCDTQSCEPAERGDWDLWQWAAALNGNATRDAADAAVGGLVKPIACVAVDNRLVTLEIAWEGDRQLSAGTILSDCGSGAYGPDGSRRQLLQISSYIGAQ
jgi:type IV pilus assembly protein PilV